MKEWRAKKHINKDKSYGKYTKPLPYIFTLLLKDVGMDEALYIYDFYQNLFVYFFRFCWSEIEWDRIQYPNIWFVALKVYAILQILTLKSWWWKSHLICKSVPPQ